MAQSVAQAANKILNRLKRLKKLPVPVVNAAHQLVQATIPVYTGTYRDAVQLAQVSRDGAEGAALSVTHESLTQSATSHAGAIRDMALPRDAVTPEWYAYGSPSRNFPPFSLTEGSTPYVTRIEEVGSPLGYGQGVWAAAITTARRVFTEGFQKAVGGAA